MINKINLLIGAGILTAAFLILRQPDCGATNISPEVEEAINSYASGTETEMSYPDIASSLNEPELANRGSGSIPNFTPSEGDDHISLNNLRHRQSVLKRSHDFPLHR